MLNADNTLIIAIDIQEKLTKMLDNCETISLNCEKILKAADILNIKTLLTEQYPKGLGRTIEPIKAIKDFDILEKTTFSAFGTEEIAKYINDSKKENIVIFGIESHICVYQTVTDLLKEKYKVYVVADCCASRSEINYKTALELMKQEGAKITTLEIVLFEFLKSSKHPDFKPCQALIK